MQILVVTENYLVGGLETHIRDLINFRLEGTIVNVAAKNCDIENFVASVGFQPFIYKDEAELLEITESLNPDILHLHPFSSITEGASVAKQLSKPYVITLHGPTSIRSDYLVEYQEANEVFCVSGELQSLYLDLTGSDSKLLINAIDTQHYRPLDPVVTNSLAIVSRLDGDKIPGINALLDMAPHQYVNIYGSGDATDQIHMKPNVQICGPNYDIYASLSKGYTTHAGMGRAFLECLACNVPTILVGYDGVKGLATRELFESARYANFSGRGLPTIDKDTFLAQLWSCITAPLTYKLCELVPDIRPVAEEYYNELANIIG